MRDGLADRNWLGNVAMSPSALSARDQIGLAIAKR
jgi:hypothetical protein